MSKEAEFHNEEAARLHPSGEKADEVSPPLSATDDTAPRDECQARTVKVGRRFYGEVIGDVFRKHVRGSGHL